MEPVELPLGPVPDDWRKVDAEAIRVALGLDPLGVGARAILRPTFHPESALELRLLPGGLARFTLAEAGSSVWGYADRQGDRPAPVVRVVESDLPPARAEAVLRSLAALPRAELTVAPEVGRDGIELLGELALPGQDALRFPAWCPQPGSAQHTFFGLLHAAALELVPGDWAQGLLERLHGELELGPPVRLLAGPPRTLRLFSRVDARDRRGLQRTLASVTDAGPLLVDLSPLTFVDDALRPSLRALLGRPGPTAWLLSTELQAKAGVLGIPDAWRFTDRAAAARALSAGG